MSKSKGIAIAKSHRGESQPASRFNRGSREGRWGGRRQFLSQSRELPQGSGLQGCLGEGDDGEGMLPLKIREGQKQSREAQEGVIIPESPH